MTLDYIGWFKKIIIFDNNENQTSIGVSYIVVPQVNHTVIIDTLGRKCFLMGLDRALIPAPKVNYVAVTETVTVTATVITVTVTVINITVTVIPISVTAITVTITMKHDVFKCVFCTISRELPISRFQKSNRSNKKSGEAL